MYDAVREPYALHESTADSASNVRVTIKSFFQTDGKKKRVCLQMCVEEILDTADMLSQNRRFYI